MRSAYSSPQICTRRRNRGQNNAAGPALMDGLTANQRPADENAPRHQQARSGSLAGARQTSKPHLALASSGALHCALCAKKAMSALAVARHSCCTWQPKPCKELSLQQPGATVTVLVCHRAPGALTPGAILHGMLATLQTHLLLLPARSGIARAGPGRRGKVRCTNRTVTEALHHDTRAGCEAAALRARHILGRSRGIQ